MNSGRKKREKSKRKEEKKNGWEDKVLSPHPQKIKILLGLKRNLKKYTNQTDHRKYNLYRTSLVHYVLYLLIKELKSKIIWSFICSIYLNSDIVQFFFGKETILQKQQIKSFKNKKKISQWWVTVKSIHRSKTI